MKKFLTTAVLAVLFVSVSSVRAFPHSDNFNLCFRKAAVAYKLNPIILKAIALTESSLHPYAVCVNGKSHLFENPVSAYNFLKNHLSENPDIGLMQVNYLWFKKLRIPFWYGLNPCYNIMLGAYVLKKKIDTYGKGWFGIAAYHSASPEKNIRYAWRVYGAVERLLNVSE